MKVLKSVFHCFVEKAKSAKVKAAVLAAATASAMAPVAMASEGSVAETVQDMTTVMAGFEFVVILLERVWSLLLSNPLLTLFLAAGLVSVGVKAFRKLKGAAKG